MTSTLRIRTITAFCDLGDAHDPALTEALTFLQQARARVLAAGYEVQTTRVAARLASARPDDEWRRRVIAIDEQVTAAQALWATGPELAAADLDQFPEWCARVLGGTSGTFMSIDVGDAARGVDLAACRAAGRTVAALAHETEGGEGNFHFAAAACCPPGLPFFPAARHDGSPAFALGLESAGLVDAAYVGGATTPAESLRAMLEKALTPLESLCLTLASEHTRRWVGIDTSPAPGLDASIAGALERVIGAPFGSPGTLRACAATTAALQSAHVRRCGYSGLMLPVLEDRVLAARASEERYRLQDLLLWSSVCGTGFDVVPLPGDAPPAVLARWMADVAALAVRLQKPLSARLLPVPGARAGEMSRFRNPLLVNARVFEV